MYTSNRTLSAHRADQIFTFLIKDDSVTRATVTLYAGDLDVAWNRIHALFPDSDLSDTEVQHRGRH